MSYDTMNPQFLEEDRLRRELEELRERLSDAPEERTQILTQEAAREMGFSPEELGLLVSAGVLVDERRAGPWQPETLEDVDWLLSRRLQLRAETEQRTIRYQEALKRLEAADRALARFDERCREITLANLPRKKDGSFAKKSLILDRSKVQITTRAGGPKVVDEAAVCEYLRREGDALGTARELGAALRVTLTETHEGEEALAYLCEEIEGVTMTVKVLHKPVIEYVASLPPEEVTPAGVSLEGEYHPPVTRPATIPGVEILPPEDRWSWE